MSARYQFLPWVRAGAASAYGNSDTLKRGARARRHEAADRPAGRLQGQRHAGHVPLRLYGPGDVLGVDPRAIIRTEPAARHAATSSPTTWPRSTSTRPTSRGCSRPRPRAATGGCGRGCAWSSSGATRPRCATGGPLPVLDVATSELPDLLESYAWAHAQVVQADATEPVAQILASAPERTAVAADLPAPPGGEHGLHRLPGARLRRRPPRRARPRGDRGEPPRPRVGV